MTTPMTNAQKEWMRRVGRRNKREDQRVLDRLDSELLPYFARPTAAMKAAAARHRRRLREAGRGCV